MSQDELNISSKTPPVAPGLNFGPPVTMWAHPIGGMEGGWNGPIGIGKLAHYSSSLF